MMEEFAGTIFPLHIKGARYYQVIYRYQWHGNTLERVDGNEIGHYDFFSSEKNDDMIYSLNRIVKSKSAYRQKKLFEDWVNEYGFLGADFEKEKQKRIKEDFKCDPESIDWRSESLTSFLREAQELVLLWDRYMQMTQRQTEKMSEWIDFIKVGGEAAKQGVNSVAVYDSIYPKTLTEILSNITKKRPYRGFVESTDIIKKDPTPYLQSAALAYLLCKAEKRIQGVEINSSLFGYKVEELTEEDIFTAEPHILCYSLLEAFYFWFFTILSSKRNVRVCPYCYKLFTVKKKNQIYCNRQCQERAKRNRFYRNKGK